MRTGCGPINGVLKGVQPADRFSPTHGFPRRRGNREGNVRGEDSYTSEEGPGPASPRTRGSLCSHKRTPHLGSRSLRDHSSRRSKWRISTSGADEGETPERRPPTFDGRRRTGEERGGANRFRSAAYLTDAGVLDATSWGNQADADQCACQIARNPRRGARAAERGGGERGREGER